MRKICAISGILVLMGFGACRGQELPAVSAAERFAKVDAWMQDNARKMGGRAGDCFSL
jgi:hypothetical protein